MEPTEGTGIVTEWPIAEGSLTTNGAEHHAETAPLGEREIDLIADHVPANERRADARAFPRSGNASTRRPEALIRPSATRQHAEALLAAQEAAVREIVDRVLHEVALPPAPIAETPVGTRGTKTPETAPAAAPVAETPVAETPVTETPVTETPVATTPLAETEVPKRSLGVARGPQRWPDRVAQVVAFQAAVPPDPAPVVAAEAAAPPPPETPAPEPGAPPASPFAVTIAPAVRPYLRLPGPNGARRRRVRGAVILSVAAALFLVGGAAFGIFRQGDNESTQSSSATMTRTHPAVANCPIEDPAGRVSTRCTFTAVYPGPAPASLVADVLIETQAGQGGINLYTPVDGANALQIRISSTTPSVTYEVPADATRCPADAPAGSICYELDNEVVSATAVRSARVVFNVSAKLPPTAPSGYRGARAQVIVTARPVRTLPRHSAARTTAGPDVQTTPNARARSTTPPAQPVQSAARSAPAKTAPNRGQ